MPVSVECCTIAGGVCTSIHLGCRSRCDPVSDQTNDSHVMFHLAPSILRAILISEKEKAAEKHLHHNITLKIAANLLFEMLIYRRKGFGINPKLCNYVIGFFS